jgi:hypothetical protein
LDLLTDSPSTINTVKLTMNDDTTCRSWSSLVRSCDHVSLPIIFDHAPKHMHERLSASKWPPMVFISCVMWLPQTPPSDGSWLWLLDQLLRSVTTSVAPPGTLSAVTMSWLHNWQSTLTIELTWES